MMDFFDQILNKISNNSLNFEKSALLFENITK